nr:hypothetical protein [Nocardia terpenica]
MDAHPLHAQHLRPDPGQGGLALVARFVVAADRLDGQLRQPPPVGLAVGSQWHPVDSDEVRRNHVVRQGFRQPGPQIEVITLAVGDIVGDEHPAAVGGFAIDHHRVANIGQGDQGVLHLAELDPVAADLHLIVDAAQILDGAVGEESSQITGAVEPPGGPERVGAEALGGQVRPIEVSAGHLHAADAQLPGHADGLRPIVLAEHIDRGVVHRRPDRHPGHRTRCRGGAFERGDIDRRLRRAVQVHQRGPLVEDPVELVDAFRGQRLAAAEHVAQRRHRPVQRGVLRERLEERAEHGRHEMHRGDRVLPHRAHDLARILLRARRQQRHPRTGLPPPEQLPHRDIERGRRLLQERVAGPDRVPALHPHQPIGHRVVFDHDTLRAAGRARGVDDVGDVLGGPGGGERGVGAVPQIGDAQHGGQLRARVDPRRGQHGRGGAVGQQHPDSVGRIGRVDGHIRAARLENAEQAGQQFRAAPGHDRDPLAGADTGRAQRPRHLIGPPLQLPVGDGVPGRVVHDRRRLGCPGGLLGEAAVQRLLRRILHQRTLIAADRVLVLVVGEHGQVLRRQFADLQPLPDQLGDVHTQRLRGEVAVEHVAGVVQVHPQLLFAVERLHHDRQRVRVVHGRHHGRRHRDIRNRLRPREMQIRQRHVEQLAPVGARGGQRPQDLAERQPLVLAERADRRADPSGELVQRHLLRGGHPQRKVVGELGDEVALPVPAAVQERDTHHDLLGAVDAAEADRQGGGEIRERGHVVLEDPPHELVLDHERAAPAVRAPDAGAREQGGRHPVEIVPVEIPIPLVFGRIPVLLVIVDGFGIRRRIRRRGRPGLIVGEDLRCQYIESP